MAWLLPSCLEGKDKGKSRCQVIQAKTVLAAGSVRGPPKSNTHSLGPLDHMLGCNRISLSLIFDRQGARMDLECLEQALAHSLGLHPWLAGHIEESTQPHGKYHLRMVLSNQGAEWRVQRSELTLQELLPWGYHSTLSGSPQQQAADQDGQPTQTTSPLRQMHLPPCFTLPDLQGFYSDVPKNRKSTWKEKAPLLHVCVTMLDGGSGVVVVVEMPHMVGDVHCLKSFMQCWTQIYSRMMRSRNSISAMDTQQFEGMSNQGGHGARSPSTSANDSTINELDVQAAMRDCNVQNLMLYKMMSRNCPPAWQADLDRISHDANYIKVYNSIMEPKPFQLGLIRPGKRIFFPPNLPKFFRSSSFQGIHIPASKLAEARREALQEASSIGSETRWLSDNDIIMAVLCKLMAKKLRKNQRKPLYIAVNMRKRMHGIDEPKVACSGNYSYLAGFEPIGHKDASRSIGDLACQVRRWIASLDSCDFETSMVYCKRLIDDGKGMPGARLNAKIALNPPLVATNWGFRKDLDELTFDGATPVWIQPGDLEYGSMIVIHPMPPAIHDAGYMVNFQFYKFDGKLPLNDGQYAL